MALTWQVSLAFFFLVFSSLGAGSAFQIWGHSWRVVQASDWSLSTEQGSAVLHLLVGKEPAQNLPRRPVQFALAEAGPFSKLTITADVEPLGRSLILVYAYQDAAHFDYAHLSTDTAAREPHHNGIFHVFGGERVRISDVRGPAAFPAGRRWYHVVLQWDGASGEVQVSADGHDVPALHAVDVSLHSGTVGLGSFDETATFRNVVLQPDAHLNLHR